MKKFLLMLVICISSFMIYTNNAKASSMSSLTYAQMGLSNFYNAQSNTWTISLNTTHSWNNWGDSTLIFSFAQQCLDGGGNNVCINGGVLPPIVGVTITTNDTYTCDIGSTTSYTDSGVLYNLYTAKCRGNFGSNGLTNITFTYQGVPYVWVLHLGSYFTVIQNDNNSQAIVNAIEQNNNNQTLQEIKSNINSSINALAGTIESSTNSTNNAINNASSQAHQDAQDINNSIKNENVSGAESSADDLKNNSAFQDNTGLSGIISMPLTFVNSLTNTCAPINLNIPYMDVNLSIPCMQPIITNKMPLLANLIKIIVNGFIVYRILLDIFQIVRNAKNPEDDRIEVLDL